MSKPIPIRRVRSPIKPRRDNSLDAVANLLGTIEGRNNLPKRRLPPLDSGQAMKVLMVRTATEPCYLCRGAPYGVQILRIPELDHNPSREAMIFYSLCFDCKADVASPAKAEKMIMEYIQFENIQAAAH